MHKIKKNIKTCFIEILKKNIKYVLINYGRNAHRDKYRLPRDLRGGIKQTDSYERGCADCRRVRRHPLADAEPQESL